MDDDLIQARLSSLEAERTRMEAFHTCFADKIDWIHRLGEDAYQWLRTGLDNSQQLIRYQADLIVDLHQAYGVTSQQSELLLAECERRYPALRLSQDLGLQVESMRRQLHELSAEMDLKDRCIEDLQSQLHSLAQKHEQPPCPSPPSISDDTVQRIKRLEEDLEQSRQEANLRLHQLRLLEAELEFFSAEVKHDAGSDISTHDKPACPEASDDPKRDLDLMNSNRSRLLAQG